MSNYPLSLVSSAEMPTRVDGAIIYGQHVNLLQDEVIAMQATLGIGSATTVASLLEGGFDTLADRLRNMSDRLTQADVHRASSSGIHGIEGRVVGTTDTQILSNKTLANPKITGAVAAGGTTWSGTVTFNNDVTVKGKLTAEQFALKDFTDSQHDHSDAANGGRIPLNSVYDPKSGMSLEELLSSQADMTHTHTRAQILDFRHDLTDHNGNLPASRITGLGTAAGMNVPSTPGTAAGHYQVVRGDDPRLSGGGGGGGTSGIHASTHRTGGSDPLSPSMIGAAAASHTHTKSQITDFAHTLDSHSGTLDQSKVTGLAAALAGKLPTTGTAADTTKVNGKRVLIQRAAPTWANIGDVWISW